MNTSEIIAAIASRCQDLGLTYGDLAARAKISRKTLYNFMSRGHDIGWRKLDRIFDSLDMTVTIKLGKGRPTESELQDIFREDDE